MEKLKQFLIRLANSQNHMAPSVTNQYLTVIAGYPINEVKAAVENGWLVPFCDMPGFFTIAIKTN